MLASSGLDIVTSIKNGSLSSIDYVQALLGQIEREEGRLHSFLTICKEEVLDRAGLLDQKIKRKESVGLLCGLGIAVKDNISTQGIRTTCGSKILENFVPPYNATGIERILREDGIVLGKTNMDEFAMGTSTENSAFGSTRNPVDHERVPGGSSGGSGAAVASGEATMALGADTGGSIRCPASFCGHVGLKPTYGLVSRYGLVSYGNSLEQIGPMTRSVRDAALLLNVIAGKDEYDSTSVERPVRNYLDALTRDVKGIRVGVVNALIGEGTQPEVSASFFHAAKSLESLGMTVEDTDLPGMDFALPAYYIIAMSEASSNLARYDGLRFGWRVPDKGLDWETAFSKTRSTGFGAEVKRRIVLGTYVLSAGYYDQYYVKAQRIRRLISESFSRAFKKYDILIGPTMPVLPFRLGEKITNPLELYMCDVDTVPANLAGIPALSIPCGSANGLPVGLQLMAPAFREDLLIQVGHAYETSVAS